MKLVIIALLASTAAAEPWRATEGSIEAGVMPGNYIVSTNAAPGRYSQGTAIAPTEVELPYQFDLHLRRLGPEAGRSMHILVAGGIVLIKENAISFYAYDDAAFASGEWKHLDGYRANDDHAIHVHQDAARVTVIVDDRVSFGRRAQDGPRRRGHEGRARIPLANSGPRSGREPPDRSPLTHVF